MEYLNSKELLINIPAKDIPPYNPNKHFFEQSNDVIQFYMSEMDKITNGVNIGGYFINPWLYFHINVFKTPIPIIDNQGRRSEEIMTPLLDDNALIVTETFEEAKKVSRGMFLFGTRGSTKSVLLASNTHWTNLVRPNGVFSITGGDKGDLGEVFSLLYHSLDNCHPAFTLPTLKRDEEKEIVFGVRYANKNTYRNGRIKILNADGGKDNKSEKGAGGSPIGFIVDEAAKFSCLKVWKSAIPSFITPTGYKAVPILAGTSGNDSLSSDAKKMLTNPESYKLLPVNYSRLERFIREEDITWNNTKNRPFGTFLPGQMSYRIEVEKEKKTLSEVLGIPNEHLSKININCTNWKKASEWIENELNTAADEEGRDTVRMYYPRDLDDVFLTKGRNSFPKEAIKRRIEELKEKGTKARNVELLPRESWFEEFYSDKKLAPTYYSGGIVDAPITLFTSLPDREPPKFRNVAGLDHYKLDGPAAEGSLGSFYVIQRRNVDINTPCEIILASYAARPNTHRVFNTTGERLLKVFNSLCNMESVDTSFQQHLQQKKIADSLLCPSFSFAQNKSGKNTSLTTKYGLYPTTGNNKVRMDYLFEWAKEEHVVGIADDGNQIIKLSVEFIDDIELLQEMLDYNSKGNFDRIAAFSHALIYARELDNANVTPKSENTVRENVNKKPIEKRATFTQNKRKVFR